MSETNDSRIEKLLKAILGQEVQLEPRESRVERLLYAILTGGSYNEPTLSEMEDILLCILHDERYDGPTNSRINALLKVKANGGSYDEPRLSRIEELIYEWINGGDISTYTGTLPTTLQTVAGFLESYKIWGNTGGVGVETENLIDVTNVSDDGYLDSNGQIRSSPNYHVSQYISVEPDTDYIYGTIFGTYVSNVCVVEYDDAYQFVKGTSFGSETSSMRLHTHTDTRYVRCSIRIVRQATTYLVKGADELTKYIPYGYKLPILSNDTTTDIYIGDTALAKDEYVDSSEGKIYRWEDITGLSEPLYGIGEYTDTLDLSTGTLTRRLKKMRLINPASVTTTSSGYRLAFFISSYPAPNYQSGTGICNIAVWAGDYSRIGFVTSSRSLFITQNIAEWATIEGATAWLDEHEIYAWYVLAEPEISTVPVPSGLTGTIEGYLIQDGTPTPETPIYPTANGVKQEDGTYSIESVSLTPTDPPAPLPQIPTFAGETTISYGGEGAQPEKVELKYRK